MRRLLTVVLLAGAGLLLAAAVALHSPDPAGAAPRAKGPPPRSEPDGPKPGRGPATRPGSSGRYHRYSRPLTKEQEQEVLDYIKKKRPDLHSQVVEYRQKDPRRYQRTVRMMWGFVSQLKRLPPEVAEAHEALQQARVRMWRIVRDLREPQNAAEKKRLEAQLRDQAATAFDAEQTIRGHRLTELAEQIKDLKAELRARAADRDNRIHEMVEWMKRGASRSSGPPSGPPADRGKPSRQPGGKGKGKTAAGR